MRFLSAEPKIRLTKAFATPYRNVVATAKTCYSSKGIVDDANVGERGQFGPLAQSIYEAGHHTTFQHAHFQFAMENVSRQFLWSFLHSHPFYNSEQVSQRYVHVKPETAFVPDLPGAQLAVYRECLQMQFDAYEHLCGLLEGPTRSEFYKRFNFSERMKDRHERTIKKKSQEAARYVLPVATFAYLYHTVSGITLLRYWRACQQQDVPGEQRFVVERMVQELLAQDRDYEITLQEPLPAEFFPEHGLLAGDAAQARAFCDEFDGRLGGRVSRLAGHAGNAEELVADSVREMLGLTRAQLSDDDAIGLACSPAKNRLLGESLNLSTMSKLTRALHHASFTFRKKLSHAADSQDQRHRMTPGSRPFLSAHLHGEPDYITPMVVRSDDAARRFYDETMARIWQKIAKLRAAGASAETLVYLLPNAASVRFTESSDYLNLRHKHQMRLCYNAQEEIWQASVEEAAQVREVAPVLGRNLLPPCGVRSLAGQKPICPEGARFCGVRVWKLDLKEYQRVI
ncbi:FAD-dependent thymidylate synthase [Candidatus Sumerlaeota bacterium]|nr:FAD-dependent thymidylate synthase [Candidatus Sumerlaeota bacterium]